MLISVVIPTYNRAALLPSTLDAVLAQTLAPLEVIVVNDGSEDDTIAIMSRYKPRVQLITIENSGDLVARNTGLRSASGELVAFCDSDDLWKPEYLAEMVRLWSAEPRIKAAYSDFVIIRDGQWGVKRKFADAPPGFWDGLRRIGPDLGVFEGPVVDRLIVCQPLVVSCMVVDRQFFLDIGGWDESVGKIVGKDFATTLRVAEHFPIGIVDHPLVGIRKHSGNYSGDVQAMNLGNSMVLEHVLANRPMALPYAEAIRSSILRRRRQAFDIAFAKRDVAGVREIFALTPKTHRPAAMQVKYMVALLPAPMSHVVTSVLLLAGSIRAHIGKRLARAPNV